MAKLYFKYGAMGSSKTAQALITKYNYEENDLSVWLIKPSADVRDGQSILRSRIGEVKQDALAFRERRAAKRAEKACKSAKKEGANANDASMGDASDERPPANSWERQAREGEQIRHAVMGDTGALPIVNGEVQGVPEIHREIQTTREARDDRR